MKTPAEIIAEVLFCDHGIGENTEPDRDTNKSDEIAQEILAALENEGYRIVEQPAAPTDIPR